MARGSAPRASGGGAGGSAKGWLAGRVEGAGEIGVGAQDSFGKQEVVDVPLKAPLLPWEVLLPPLQSQNHSSGKQRVISICLTGQMGELRVRG